MKNEAEMQEENKKSTNFIVIRDPAFYKFHQMNSEDAVEFGILKALILGNLDKFDRGVHRHLHEAFPYIAVECFYELLNELLELGVLKYEE